jgi:hypothetical protein
LEILKGLKLRKTKAAAMALAKADKAVVKPKKRGMTRLLQP